MAQLIGERGLRRRKLLVPALAAGLVVFVAVGVPSVNVVRAPETMSPGGRSAEVRSSLFGTLLAKKGRGAVPSTRTSGGPAGAGEPRPERFAEVKPVQRSFGPAGAGPALAPFAFSAPFAPAPVPGATGPSLAGGPGGGGFGAPPFLPPSFGGGGGGGVGAPPATPEPPVTEPEPPVTTPEPPVTTPEPPVTTPQPPVPTPEPPVVTPQPPVVAPEPPVTNPEPPVPPPTTSPEPPVPNPEPPVVTPVPPINPPAVPGVPEPATWFLLLTGFGALGVRLRSRKRRERMRAFTAF